MEKHERNSDGREEELGHSIRFLTPEIAIVHLRWEMRGDPGQPGHEVEGGIRQGIFTPVAVKREEGWRLAASQNTDIKPIPDFLHTVVATTAA
jgi:hypothetical protein